MELPDTNPKTILGVAKPSVADIPPVAILTLGQGMSDGARKYGRTNWREHEVTASVYYNAAMRHLMAWWDGEQEADDSGVHHLGHAMACLAILVDAEASGKLVDDRPSVPGMTAEFIARLTQPAAPRVEVGSHVEMTESEFERAMQRFVYETVWQEMGDSVCDDLFGLVSDCLAEDEDRSEDVHRAFEHIGVLTTATERRAMAFYLSCIRAGAPFDAASMDDFLEGKGV